MKVVRLAKSSTRYGARTRIAAVKGRCPSPVRRTELIKDYLLSAGCHPKSFSITYKTSHKDRHNPFAMQKIVLLFPLSKVRLFYYTLITTRVWLIRPNHSCENRTHISTLRGQRTSLYSKERYVKPNYLVLLEVQRKGIKTPMPSSSI